MQRIQPCTEPKIQLPPRRAHANVLHDLKFMMAEEMGGPPRHNPSQPLSALTAVLEGTIDAANDRDIAEILSSLRNGPAAPTALISQSDGSAADTPTSSTAAPPPRPAVPTAGASSRGGGATEAQLAAAADLKDSNIRRSARMAQKKRRRADSESEEEDSPPPIKRGRGRPRGPNYKPRNTKTAAEKKAATEKKNAGTRKSKRAKKATPPARAGPKAISSEDEARIDSAIKEVQSRYGTGAEGKKKLAKTTFKGVTMRPSGKWQAQLYYAGKSRYLGVFIRKEAAAMGYEVARELLKEGKEVNGIRVLGKKKLSAGQTDDLLTVARRAARKAGEIVEGYSYKSSYGPTRK